jgi:DNA adenine methylase
VSIEHLPWQECVARYDRPHTLFFADPPYWQAVDYGVPFEWDQFVALAEAMRTTKGRMIVTINDHPDIRKAFAGIPCQRVPITYTCIGAGAKGHRRATGEASSLPTSELIYRSWK